MAEGRQSGVWIKSQWMGPKAGTILPAIKIAGILGGGQPEYSQEPPKPNQIGRK